MADDSKLVARLGQRMPLPIEVVPFGWSTHLDFLRFLGGEPFSHRSADGSPFLSDEGYHTLDVRFAGPEGERAMSEPYGLDRALRSRAGIVESGFFLGLTLILVVARHGKTEILRRPRQ